MAATMGVARTVLVVRAIDVQDYALIAIAESARTLISTFTSLGIAESLGREAALRDDGRDRLNLIWVAYAAALALAAIASLVILGTAAFHSYLSPDTRLGD